MVVVAGEAGMTYVDAEAAARLGTTHKRAGALVGFGIYREAQLQATAILNCRISFSCKNMFIVHSPLHESNFAVRFVCYMPLAVIQSSK